MHVLIATQSEVLTVPVEGGELRPSRGLDGQRPTCLAVDRRREGRAWCGTNEGGIFRSDDAGVSWEAVGLAGERLTAVAAASNEDVVWVGTEPSSIWRTEDGGSSWERMPDLEKLPSSADWSFPPKPETHHVRWIACHPREPGRLWVAIEAGALISSHDGGRTWRDRVPGGPFDTHELAVHIDTPEWLRVSAGDGYFESRDGGETWSRPRQGLEVGYLRSVAIDPGRADVVVVSAASRPRSTYAAGASDGRVYRRVGEERWERITDGWPDPPSTIAPLLIAGGKSGELWAADERGVHRSEDGGGSWRQLATYPKSPHYLRGIGVILQP